MKRIVLFLSFLFLIPLVTFAQDLPPTDWGDIILNPGKWFASFGLFSLLVAFVTTFLNGILKIIKRFPRQLISWGVAIILLIATNLLNWGYAADFTILLTIIHGLGAGLAANGVFDIPLIKSILTALEGILNPQKE